jgi:hypothetical protein
MFSNPEAFAKYLAVTSIKQGITRNYSLVFCADNAIFTMHQKMLQALNNEEDFDSPYKEIRTIDYKYVNLVLRKKNDYSKSLCDESAKGTEFVLQGPLVLFFIIINI